MFFKNGFLTTSKTTLEAVMYDALSLPPREQERLLDELLDLQREREAHGHCMRTQFARAPIFPHGSNALLDGIKGRLCLATFLRALFKWSVIAIACYFAAALGYGALSLIHRWVFGR